MVSNVQVTTVVVFDGKKDGVTLGDPVGVAVDRGGHAIVVDARSHCVRKVVSDRSATIITTLAGKGREGNDDGQGTLAAFNLPIAVAVDLSGNAIVADAYNHRIRKITPGCMVTTVAGSVNARFEHALTVDELAATIRNQNGNLDEISNDVEKCTFSFSAPRGVAVDGNGNVIVADTYMHRIRKIDRNGRVTTLAGSGNPGYADGKSIDASFNYPAGVALDGDGNVIVADTYNDRIRKIWQDGTVTTLAGSVSANMRDGPGFAASFNCPRGLAIDGDGNLIVADTGNHSIRMVTPDRNVTTLAGTGHAGCIDGQGLAAGFSDPYDVAVDFNGNVLVADTGSKRLRLITAGLKPPGRRHQMRMFYTLVALRELLATNRASLVCEPVLGPVLGCDSTELVLPDLQKFLMVLPEIPNEVIQRIAVLL
jgi:hypothetical protein